MRVDAELKMAIDRAIDEEVRKQTKAMKDFTEILSRALYRAIKYGADDGKIIVSEFNRENGRLNVKVMADRIEISIAPVSSENPSEDQRDNDTE